MKFLPKLAPALLAAGLVLAAASAAPQTQQFEARVARVRVDVIVQDDDGEFVDDLDIGDFRLFEDGVEQEITGIQLVDLSNGLLFDRTAPGSAAESATDGPAGAGATTLAAETDPAAGTPDQRSSDFGAMIFLLDFSSLDMGIKGRFMNAWENVVEDTNHLRTPRAVYVIDQVGRLEEVTPLTQDPAVLLRSVRELDERAVSTPAHYDEQFDFNRRGDQLVRQYRDRSKSIHTFEVLRQLAEGLTTRSGRTALVLVSSGYQTTTGSQFWNGGGDSLWAGGAGLPGGPPGEAGVFDGRVVNRQANFYGAANSANISVYTIDPTPLIRRASGMADVRVGRLGDTSVTTPMGWSGPRPGMNTTMLSRQNALYETSNITGGVTYANHADLSRVLRDIEEDTSRYYLLTYAPPQPEGDGLYHEIEVHVARDDLDVRARHGYIDYTADERRANTLGGALALPGAVADLPFHAEARQSWSATGGASVLIAGALDITELDWAIDLEGAQAIVEFHAVALNDDFEIAAEHHTGVGRRFTMEESRAQSRNRDLVGFQHVWSLEPGEYSLRVVAIDNSNGRIGSVRLELDIAEPEEGEWRTSDLLLAETNAAGNRRPVVDGVVAPGRTVHAMIEVYGGAAPAVGGTLTPLADEPEADGRDIPGEPAALEPVIIAPVLMSPGAGSTHGALLSLPTVPPGRYRLELVVQDATVRQRRTYELVLEVMTPTVPAG